MRTQTLIISLALMQLMPARSPCQVESKAAREAAEYVMRKFTKDVAKESVITLTRKIEVLVAKHGDEALIAVRRVGPRAFRIIEEAGEHGFQTIQLMAKYGEQGIWVAANPRRLSMFAKLGDNAAESMIKHGEIAEPLLNSFGKPAADALKTLSSQNARRLAMMAEDQELAGIGHTPQLLEVISKYGDRAMDFIWKNKGSLTVAGGITAFIAHPEPFLSGLRDITKVAAENGLKPIAAIPGQVASAAAANTNWTMVLLAITLVLGGIWGMKVWLHHRRTQRPSEANGHS